MSDIEKLGGLEAVEKYAKNMQDWEPSKQVIESLIAKVKELEGELAHLSKTCDSADNEVLALESKLQSARELAEMLIHTASVPMGVFSCAILSTYWDGIQAKAREFLEELK